MGPESRAEGTGWAGAEGAAEGTPLLTHVGLEEICGSWEAGGRGHSPRCPQTLWYHPVSHPNDPRPSSWPFFLRLPAVGRSDLIGLDVAATLPWS